MTDIAWVCLAVMWVGVIAYWIWFMRRFRKPADPFKATLECQPGKSQLTLMLDGRPVAVLILHSVTRDLHAGSSAQFVDLSHYIEERTYWP